MIGHKIMSEPRLCSRAKSADCAASYPLSSPANQNTKKIISKRNAGKRKSSPAVLY